MCYFVSTLCCRIRHERQQRLGIAIVFRPVLSEPRHQALCGSLSSRVLGVARLDACFGVESIQRIDDVLSVFS